MSCAARWYWTKISGRKVEKRNNVIYKSFDNTALFAEIVSRLSGILPNFRRFYSLPCNSPSIFFFFFFITLWSCFWCALLNKSLLLSLLTSKQHKLPWIRSKFTHIYMTKSGKESLPDFDRIFRNALLSQFLVCQYNAFAVSLFFA